MRSISDLARLVKRDRQTILRWLSLFEDHFSEFANPQKEGASRRFTESDARVATLISMYWEGLETDEISAMLNREEHLQSRILNYVRLNTPIFQELPDDLDETWDHGVMLGGMGRRFPLDVARSYRYAVHVLMEKTLAGGDRFDFDYPIFFLYRHTLELYLKLILGDPKVARKHGHSILKLVAAVETKVGPLGDWFKDRLQEFADIDPTSDLFRFSDRQPKPKISGDGEFWVDFAQLQATMERVFDELDDLVRTAKRLKP